MVDLVFATVRTLGPMIVLALWVGSAGWTFADTRRRCPDRTRAWCAAAVALPVVGAALYALLRPCDDDRSRWSRDVWRRYLESELDPGDRCLACLIPLEPAYVCCPGCGNELRTPCAECGTLLRVGWSACPACARPARAGAERRAPAVRVAA